MKSENMKRKFSIQLAIVCFLTLLLPSLCSAAPKNSATMEEMLTSLDYEYVSASKDFFAIQCGSRKIFVTKKPKRNPVDNVVKHMIFTFWQPIFLEKNAEKKVLALTKDPAKGKYFTESAGPRKRIGFGFLSVPKNISEKDLNDMITQCANANFPVKVNQRLQYKYSIEEVLALISDIFNSNNPKEITTRLSKIDVSYCPADFQQAVYNLFRIINVPIQVNNNTRSNEIIIKTSEEAFIGDLVNGLATIAGSAIKMKEIEKACFQMIQVARRYGVAF